MTNYRTAAEIKGMSSQPARFKRQITEDAYFNWLHEYDAAVELGHDEDAKQADREVQALRKLLK